jgi:nitrogenase-associated protein
VLRSEGVEFEVRDLFCESWSAGRLRPFFGTAPVPDWFNLSAPAVKSGGIDIHACSEHQALTMMREHPLLIRRPLMELGEVRQAGFIPGPVTQALGLVMEPEQDLQSCPMDKPQPECGAPA